MTLTHKALIKSLRMAYSAERAAAFAYQGHAGAVKDKAEKIAIRQIELDEWGHRKEVLEIMHQYNIPVSGIMKSGITLSAKLFPGLAM